MLVLPTIMWRRRWRRERRNMWVQRASNNKMIITVVSGAVVFVVINIIIKVRRVSGVHNARRRKLPRGPSLKE